jgi:hypothetical protein
VGHVRCTDFPPYDFLAGDDVPLYDFKAIRICLTSRKWERRHQIRVVESMKHLVFASALILVGTNAAKAADINLGEVRTRYQIQNELTAWERLRPWDVDWRHTYAWQHGRTIRTEFAPPGCYITRLVTTPSGTQLQELFIC